MVKAFILTFAATVFSTTAAFAQPAGGEGAPVTPRIAPRIMNMPIGTAVGDPRFNQLISTVADLNVSPGFDLNKEQKEKLKAIREEVKTAQTKWQKDNDEQIKKINEEMRQAREAAMSGGAESLRGVMEKWRELRGTFPKTDEAQKQVRALLTDQQLDALDARLEEIAKEQRKAQEEMRSRMQLMNAPRTPPGGGQ